MKKMIALITALVLMTLLAVTLATATETEDTAQEEFL